MTTSFEQQWEYYCMRNIITSQMSSAMSSFILTAYQQLVYAFFSSRLIFVLFFWVWFKLQITFRIRAKIELCLRVRPNLLARLQLFASSFFTKVTLYKTSVV